ncbi:hypothetical protein M408DRAFT_12269 [Serendipita vermifera MAFF 305830]|uniref:Uncharacterized protein n=1 Tax=Serendipita vermifera MAFF 305830 TaxID=933852 RepID=A0A0C3ARU0_SERVB|nr:hypothetical protein M408DRAFT_12269 [Serendipita vermifera MAFF 305830]
MPPRAAQKRKADDGPYALSGLKRATPNNGGSSNNGNGLYSTREHRDRDGYGVTSLQEREWYDKYGRMSYEKDMVSHSSINSSNKRRKADPANGTSAAYYQVGMNGNPMIRGEEGPLITIDMSTLPTSVVLKYLQTYNLLPNIHPSPLSAQRPQPPQTALILKPPHAAATASNRNKAWDGMDVTQTKTVKNTFSNGLTTTSSTTMYTSTLGLSGADVESVSVEDNTAMCDVEEARATLALIAQNHWNSVSSAFVSNGYSGSVGRMNERDVIDDFVVALRAKELAIRLTT